MRQLVAFKTILRKETTRINRIWTQTLLPSVITLTLYFLIFGNLIGPRIGEMQGYEYMAFIIPGLIMMAVITNSYSNVSSSFFSTKFQKNIEELLVSPTKTSTIIWGYVLGGVYRGLVVAVLVTLVSLLFSDIEFYNIVVVVSVIILTAILFALAGLFNGIFAKRFDDVAIVPTFVLTPLTYLGGVFYSIDLLPVFWQWVSKLNPILYMINAFRYGFLGVSDISLIIAFSMILIFIAVLYALCWYFIEKGYRMRS